ncbi:MAG: tRNA (guanosine(46)-N7)-methyltransferase TrmB [Planctomycetota bacterium]
MTTDSHNPTDKPRTLDLDDILLPNAFAYEDRPVDFSALFGNTRPVELEIGSGKGTFLVHRAKARPEVNFLGIEWANQYCRLAADRMARWGVRNVRMLRADAAAFARKRIPDNSLQRVHIYFPDPWPKTRHKKRRIVQPPFVEVIHRKLRVGGQLVVVTDHRGYARQMAWVIFGQPGFATVPFPRTHGAEDGEVVGTNFERKYIAQGRRFFALAVMKWQ